MANPSQIRGPQKKLPQSDETGFARFLDYTRQRSPSVADTEVRLFVPPNFQIPPESSESETDSKESAPIDLEGEFAQRGDIKWDKERKKLERAAEKTMLESPEVKKRGHRRAKSWLEAKDKVRKSLEVPIASYEALIKAAEEQEREASNSESSMASDVQLSTFRMENNLTRPHRERTSSSNSRNSNEDQAPLPVHNEPPRIEVADESSESSDGGEGTTEKQPEEDGAPSWWDDLKNSLEKGDEGKPAEPSVPDPPKSTPEESGSSLPPTPSITPRSGHSSLVDSNMESSYSSAISDKSPKIPPKKQKKGILRFDNGVYKGETIVNNDSYTLAHGHGTFTNSLGEAYIGQEKEMEKESRHGKMGESTSENGEQIGEAGLMTWGSGDLYIGEIAFGFQQGYGMLKTANGEKYIGEWNVNERHGYGVMHFANGDIYSGEWKHNKKDGPGVYRFADGTVVEGFWIENKFVDKKTTKKLKKEREKEAKREAKEREKEEKLQKERDKKEKDKVKPRSGSPLSNPRYTSDGSKSDKETSSTRLSVNDVRNMSKAQRSKSKGASLNSKDLKILNKAKEEIADEEKADKKDPTDDKKDGLPKDGQSKDSKTADDKKMKRRKSMQNLKESVDPQE